MKTPLLIAVACLGSLGAIPADAVESLPLPRHKPLYWHQGSSSREHQPHLVAVVDYVAPIRSIRPQRSAPCTNALCPSYIVLGTSY